MIIGLTYDLKCCFIFMSVAVASWSYLILGYWQERHLFTPGSWGGAAPVRENKLDWTGLVRGGGHSGPAGPNKEFHKNFTSLELRSRNSSNVSKARLFEIINGFFSSEKLLMKKLRGVGSFL